MTMKVYKAFIGCCLAGALGAPLQAIGGEKIVKLSLSEAISMARENNYTLKAARSRVEQAEARVVQSRQSYLPKVTFSETFLVTNDPGAALVFKLQQKTLVDSDFMAAKMTNPDLINDFNTSLQVMQPIFNADASAGRKMAVTAKKASEYMAMRTEEGIALQVSKVYYGLILAAKNIEAVDQSIRTMQGHSNDAAKAYRAGILTKSDKLSTEVRLSELQEQKLMLQDEIRNATDALKVMLRLDGAVSIVPTGELSVESVLPGGESATVSENRADLKALETWRDVALNQEEMVKASRLPRLNAFAQSNLHSATVLNGGSSWTVGLNMQWNIYDGMATAGRIQEARAQEQEAMYGYEAAKSGSMAEAEKALRSLKTARTRIAGAQKSLEEARVSLDFIGEQFRTGMAMTFELLMREQAYTYSKMRLNQAKYDYCVARSELSFYRGN